MNLLAEIETKGFALISSYLPELDTVNAASRIGKTLDLPGVNRVQVLTPKNKEQATPNTYSGIYGLENFPMHTDLAHWEEPPRYLALRCVVGTPLVKTRLLDFRKIAERIGVGELRRLLVQPRRPMRGRRRLHSVLEIKSGERHLFRWDSVFIEPATKISEGIYLQLKAEIDIENTIDVTLESPGDTLVIDNWRMLHGRSPVPDEVRKRRIERIYMSRIEEHC